MNATMRYALLEQRRRNSDGTFAEDRGRMENTMRMGGTRYENTNRYESANRYEEDRRMGGDTHRRVEPGRDTPTYEQGNGTFRMRYEDGENRRMIGFGGEDSRYIGPFKGDEFEHRQSTKEHGYSHSTVTMPLDRHKAEEWVKKMRNADGTTGPHWTYEQAEKLMRQKGIDCDPVIFWVCMNAEYSDRCKVYKDYGVGSIDFYADCVRAFWLEDEDAVEDKPAAYYACIVKH